MRMALVPWHERLLAFPYGSCWDTGARKLLRRETRACNLGTPGAGARADGLLGAIAGETFSEPSLGCFSFGCRLSSILALGVPKCSLGAEWLRLSGKWPRQL